MALTIADRKNAKCELFPLLFRASPHPVRGTEFKAKGLQEGKEYEFRVAAVNEAGPGKPTETDGAIKAAPPPSKTQHRNNRKYKCFLCSLIWLGWIDSISPHRTLWPFLYTHIRISIMQMFENFGHSQTFKLSPSNKVHLELLLTCWTPVPFYCVQIFIKKIRFSNKEACQLGKWYKGLFDFNWFGFHCPKSRCPWVALDPTRSIRIYLNPKYSDIKMKDSKALPWL